jgi:hypothetical protein
MFGWGDNPFKIANENSNAFKKDASFGNIASTYEIDQNFSFMARIGMDNLMILDGQRSWTR